jgi:hypothetical protein
MFFVQCNENATDCVPGCVSGLNLVDFTARPVPARFVAARTKILDVRHFFSGANSAGAPVKPRVRISVFNISTS